MHEEKLIPLCANG